MELPDFKAILLEALQYPEYARFEYFLKYQVETGWSKQVYFEGLFREISHLEGCLSELKHFEQVKLKREGHEREYIKKHLLEFGLDLEKETKGKQKGKLTNEMLTDFRFFITQAIKAGVPPPTYNSLQVLAFIERGLRFIKNEFDKQLNKEIKFFRLSDTNSKYELYQYQIISDAPIFDSIRFKEEIRNILLNVINKDELKTILAAAHSLAEQIVELWNNELYPLIYPEEDLADNEVSKTRLLIEFNENDMSFHTRVSPKNKDFFRESNKGYSNENFAQFAANVINIINREVFKNESKSDIDVKKKDETSAIAEELSEFEAIMSDDFNNLVAALTQYFETGVFPYISKKIQVGKCNIKKFGWTLSKIYRKRKANVLPYEYLIFAVENISTFEKYKITKDDFRKTNLYKSFTNRQK